MANFTAMLTGACSFGLGFSLASLGAATHNLGLLYLGAAACGVGHGCAYVPPIQVINDFTYQYHSSRR